MTHPKTKIMVNKHSPTTMDDDTARPVRRRFKRGGEGAGVTNLRVTRPENT